MIKPLAEPSFNGIKKFATKTTSCTRAIFQSWVCRADGSDILHCDATSVNVIFGIIRRKCALVFVFSDCYWFHYTPLRTGC